MAEKDYLLKYIKDAGFSHQISSSIDKTGKWPEDIKITLKVPIEICSEFLLKFENKRLQKGRNKVTKVDTIVALMDLYAKGVSTIDFSKDLYEQIAPGEYREVKKTGKRGRPKIYTDTGSEPRGAKKRLQKNLFTDEFEPTKTKNLNDQGEVGET